MKELIKTASALTVGLEKPRSLIDGAEIVDLSDTFADRVRINFPNGLALSVIRGQYTYGGDQGLFEIAAFNVKGEMDGSFFNEEDAGDDVLGYCDEDKVFKYIAKLSDLKT